MSCELTFPDKLAEINKDNLEELKEMNENSPRENEETDDNETISNSNSLKERSEIICEPIIKSSKEFKLFIESLIKHKTNERMKANEALSHVWIEQRAPSLCLMSLPRFKVSPSVHRDIVVC